MIPIGKKKRTLLSEIYPFMRKLLLPVVLHQRDIEVKYVRRKTERTETDTYFTAARDVALGGRPSL